MDIAYAGLFFLITGAVLVLVGILLLTLSRTYRKEVKVEGGGMILLGPIPIVIGTSTKWVIIVLILAIILMLLSLVANLGWTI
ncbi:MAG: DUF131 domain-containing protein [Nitrososphaeria archaeon]